MSAAISFRPLVAEDLPALALWMERPHWREWWGDPAEEIAYVRDMVEGKDTTRPFVILIDGVPSGYIQVWLVGPHQTEEWAGDNPWLMDLPADAVGVDLSLADPDQLSQGFGSAALSGFVAMLRSEGHGTIIIDPDPANGRAVACYRKAGFRPMPGVSSQGNDVLIMRHEATEAKA